MVNNGTKFMNSEMNHYLKDKGITLYMSVPYTHEKNGVVEQGIHTIMEGAHAMLYVSELPKRLWSVAVKTMAYLSNRLPAHANGGVTPIQCITGEKPNLAHLRVPDSPVSVVVPKEKWRK
jgi:hypothetical protein